MCRFVLYVGSPILLSTLVTEPANSIIHQSYQSQEREEPLNGDGFGLAWYAPDITREPALFRSVTPAWSNQNLTHLARCTRSGCVLAHVRAASQGMPVTETNTHPFVGGDYAFMHNGEIAGFKQVERELLGLLSPLPFETIQGTTDSEHLFALFLNHLPAGIDRPGPRIMADALIAAIENVLQLTRAAGISEHSYFNVAVTDGESAVVCRYTDGPHREAPSLHLHTGMAYRCEDRQPRLLPASGDDAVLVASEPLSDDPSWATIPSSHMVLIHPHRRVDVVGMTLDLA